MLSDSRDIPSRTRPAGSGRQYNAAHILWRFSLQPSPRILNGTLAALAALGLLCGCAFVHQKDREFLSDPIMQRHDDGLEATLEGHDMPRREGSVGGSSGSGGGCGC